MSAGTPVISGTLDLLILQTLADAPMHGCGIWIVSEWDVTESHRRARYYRLTASGRRQLARERDRWARAVEAVGGVLTPVRS